MGEWATRVGDPTPNMSAALGDAAWMTGMERNSDLVIMSSSAAVNFAAWALRQVVGFDMDERTELDSGRTPFHFQLKSGFLPVKQSQSASNHPQRDRQSSATYRCVCPWVFRQNSAAQKA